MSQELRRRNRPIQMPKPERSERVSGIMSLPVNFWENPIFLASLNFFRRGGSFWVMVLMDFSPTTQPKIAPREIIKSSTHGVMFSI